MKRRLAVIFMADMVDYSRLMEADRDRTIGLIGELRERWLEPEAKKRGGEVVKRMGDGWIITFGSVTDAVETAQSVQNALADHQRIKLRIAAHLGEIADDGTDLYGTGINITARLQTEAPPGGVMISEDLHRQLDETIGQGFSDAGSFDLKNIAQPVSGFQWRPKQPAQKPVDNVPVIAVAPVAATPETHETREAAADLQEQLVHRLSQRTGIRVLAIDAGGEAAPTYILRCRLRTREAVAKITLTLIRTDDGQVVWSRAFDGPGGDLFALCDDIVEMADNQLRLEINAFDGERLTGVPDDQLNPSELRARAAVLMYRCTVESYRHAQTLLERALRLDPDNAMSRAMWAECPMFVGEARFEAFEPGTIAEIVSNADRAVQAAPRSDYVFYVRAHVRSRLLGDLAGARQDIKRIERINPGYTLRFEVTGITELAAGAWDAAIAAFAECIERSQNDPVLMLRIYALAVAQLLARRFEDAATTIAEAIELRPESRIYRLLLSEIHERAGNRTAANDARAIAANLPAEPDILAPRLPLPAAEAGLMDLLAPGRRAEPSGSG